MHESPVTIGLEKRLHGMLTAADAPQVEPGAACIMMNAGVIHRVGPHRVNVKLARDLAASGVPSLRLDLSGLGDSGHARTGLSFRDQAVSDLQSAMDFLESVLGANQFLVVGLCSGAVNGYRLALADRRVHALVMFDGFVYPTRLTTVIRRWTRVTHVPWATLAYANAMAIRAAFGYRDEEAAADPAPWATSTTRDEFVSGMNCLVDRGVAVQLLYSHSLGGFNHATQMRSAFGRERFTRHVSCQYVPDIDHTVTTKAAQQQFVQMVRNWYIEVLTRERLTGNSHGTDRAPEASRGRHDRPSGTSATGSATPTRTTALEDHCP